MRCCVICQTALGANAHPRNKTCSKDCSHQYKLQRGRNWRKNNKERQAARTKEWVLRNPERYKQLRAKANKTWYLKNTEVIRERAKLHRRARRSQRAAYTRAWRANNPGKVKANRARWYRENAQKLREHARNKWAAAYANNPEKFRAASRRWRMLNPEKSREWDRRWIANNRERVRESARLRARNNLERIRFHTANRRARKRKASGSYGRDDISRLFNLQKGKCAYHRFCGNRISKRPNGYHVDHIVPLAKGGTNWPSNLQLTCPQCNVRKNAQDPIDYARRLGALV
jgi:5-methylcytosine-specific restriction endonuclease McrA